MYWASIPNDADEAQFRAVARRCLARKIAPAEVTFASAEEAALFETVPEGDTLLSFSVPQAYAELLTYAICHRAPDRFALLYDVLWRIRHGERGLADNPADASVARLNEYARNVRRDIHKMHAFLRFRKQPVDGRPVFMSWFEPQHFILHRAVPFFVDRFSSMEWFIATPIGTAAWNGSELVYGPPGERPPSCADAVLDETWLTYYRTTFNPARLRLKAMAAEIPRHYWANMPETGLIPGMVANAADVPCIARRRKPSPAKDQMTRRSCLWASSREMPRISPADPLSGRRGSCWTEHWPMLGSSAAGFISPMRSSISNMSRAASAVSTRSPMQARCKAANGGSSRKSRQ